MSPIEIPAGSVEHIRGSVSGDHLAAAGVEVSVGHPYVWVPAQWEDSGAASRSRAFRTTAPVTFTATGRSDIFVRLTDTPEAPIIKAGTIVVR